MYTAAICTWTSLPARFINIVNSHHMHTLGHWDRQPGGERTADVHSAVLLHVDGARLLPVSDEGHVGQVHVTAVNADQRGVILLSSRHSDIQI